MFATLGTKTVRLMAGRIFRPGSTQPRRDWTLPARCRMGGKTVHPSGTTGERPTRADSGGPLPRTGEPTTTPRTRWSGGASQPIVPQWCTVIAGTWPQCSGPLCTDSATRVKPWHNPKKRQAHMGNPTGPPQRQRRPLQQARPRQTPHLRSARLGRNRRWKERRK